MSQQYSLVANIIAKTDKFTSAINEAIKKNEELAKSVSNKTKAIGEGFNNVGKAMTTKVTLPIVAMGAGAIKAAIDFESAFAGVRKTVDTSEAGFKKLEKGIREMAKELPASAADIARVAENAGQLGIKEENILSFTRTMIDLGESTNMTAEEAATNFAQFANVVGMPQENFDRLGSSVVALGNNLATTEADIVNMAMRLSGVGAQVGLTEAEIMALSGAMSSVGISAEAGGSAMSLVMKKISNSVADGGKGLEKFAKASGMSSKDFAQMWQNEPIKAMDMFIKGLAESGEGGENLNAILSDLGIKGINETDTLLRLAGASELLGEAVDISTNAWKENTALSNEAAQRYETTASKLAILRNKITDVAITIGGILIPILMSVVDAIVPWVEKFGEMDEKSQKIILVMAGIAAAIGPVLLVIGSLFTGISSVISVFTAVTGAITAAGGAAAVLGSALTILTGPVGLVIATIGVVIASSIAWYKNFEKLEEKMGTTATVILGLLNPLTTISTAIKLFKRGQEDAIEPVERFGDAVSESTQVAVGAYMDMSEEADVALKQLAWSQETVTAEMAGKMVTQQQAITDNLLSAINERHNAELEATQAQFQHLDGLNEEQKAAILEKLNSRFEQEATLTQESNARINEIINGAAQEKRALTQAESDEILAIRQSMTQQAVSVMSENEAEQKVIYEKMKNNASTISALEAADVVKNSVKKKDDVIKEANKQYDETYKWAIRQRDELGTMSASEAQAVIDEAKKKRDGTIKNAEDMHKKVVDEAKKQAKEHVNEVNWETGQVKSKWEIFKGDISAKVKEIGANIKEGFKDAWLNATKYFVGLYNDAKSNFARIGTEIKTKVEDARASAINKVNAMKTGLTTAFSGIVSTASSKFKDAKNKITQPIEEAKNKISDIVSSIKGFFTNMKLSIPSIKLPKLPSPKITGSFSLTPPSVPKISWNAKGGIFDKPTIFNTANAGLQGVGEAGVEAILPLTRSVLGTIGDRIFANMKNVGTTTATNNNHETVNNYELVLNIKNMTGNKKDIDKLSEDVMKGLRKMGK